MDKYISHINTGFMRHKNGDIVYFTAPAIDSIDFYRHCFTSRIGGVSPPPFDSLNLSFKREQNNDNILENFGRICAAVPFDFNSLVMANYNHGDGIYEVTPKHLGMGITRPTSLPHCDALITRQSGVAPVTLHADCTPVFFAHTKGRAAAVCHAGWKGVYSRIIPKTISALNLPPEEIIVAIGPSIGPCCFEVQTDVQTLFEQAYGSNVIIHTDQKTYVDLWKVALYQLKTSGIPPQNVTLARQCTCCHSDLFYSHRKNPTGTGSMASIISIIR